MLLVMGFTVFLTTTTTKTAAAAATTIMKTTEDISSVYCSLGNFKS
jgi:hypothetical protein